MRGYWFGERLGYGDGRLPRVGRTHRVTGKISLCQRGLHASRHPFDALRYASSNVLWLVDLGGEVIEGRGKIAASERRYIARRNVESMLSSFARAQALSVAHLWDCPEVALEYLKTGEESLREAARGAAWDAARDDFKLRVEAAFGRVLKEER